MQTDLSVQHGSKSAAASLLIALPLLVLLLLLLSPQAGISATAQAATIDPPTGTLVISGDIPIAYEILANNGSGLRLAPFEYYVQQGDGSATQGVNCGPATVAMALRYASGNLLTLSPSQIRKAYIPARPQPTPVALPITGSLTNTVSSGATISGTGAISATGVATASIPSNFTSGFTTIPELKFALRKVGARTKFLKNAAEIWQAIESYHPVITPIRMRDISMGQDTKPIAGTRCGNGQPSAKIGAASYCYDNAGQLFSGKYVEFPFGEGRWDGHIVLINGIFTDEDGQRYFYVYDPNVFPNDPRLYYFGDKEMAKGQFRLWKFEEVEAGLRNNGGAALAVLHNPAEPVPGINLDTIRATLEASGPLVAVSEGFTFVAHESYPSATLVNPGEVILKRWKIRNSGELDFGLNYQLVQSSGERMLIHGESAIGQVRSGDEAVISAYLQMPESAGNYATVWNIVNAAGEPIRGSLRFEFTVSGENTSGRDNARFEGQETPEKDVILAPGITIRKIWRMTNLGTRPWSADYRLVLVAGDALGASLENPVPLTYPGETVDLQVYITTPETAGDYRATWQLRNAAGEFFGDLLTVEIEVR